MKKSELIQLLQDIEEDLDVCTLIMTQGGFLASELKGIEVKEVPFWEGSKKAIVVKQ